MRPRAEALAGPLEYRGMRAVPATAQLFRAGERILVGGGGLLVEVDVDRPPEAWESWPIPPGLFARDPDAAQPLLVDETGPIFRLEPDLSLREIHRVGPLAGGAAAYALSDGSVLVCTVRAALFGTYLLEADGKTRWRARATDPVLAAFDDVVLAVGSGQPNLVICRDTATGDVRWRRRGTHTGAATLVAVVDDAAWISDGTALVSVGLADGEQRACLDAGVFASTPRLDPDGRAHLVFGALRYWLLDLRAGMVASRRTFAGAPPRDPYPMEPLAGGAVLVRDGAGAMYRLESGDGEVACPAPLWRAPALPISAVVHRGGLIVLTEPAGGGRLPPMRGVHWLAPAG